MGVKMRSVRCDWFDYHLPAAHILRHQGYTLLYCIVMCLYGRIGSKFTRRCHWLYLVPVLLIAYCVEVPIASGSGFTQETVPTTLHQVEAGDTWAALSMRYSRNQQELRAANPNLNQQLQPVIGKKITIPGDNIFESRGNLLTSSDGGLLQLSVEYHQNPWLVSLQNNLANPNRPLLYRPILIPDDETQIRQLPVGFNSLQLSDSVAQPGRVLAIRATGPLVSRVTATLDNQPIGVVTLSNRMVGLFGTGAFFPPGDHELRLSVDQEPLWTQPWHFESGQWTFEEITLTGSAAAIDSASIELEYERLSEVWANLTENAFWDTLFQMPIKDYISVSSEFGARRSYNGGPYRSYHEGLDFSAYGGSAVNAPAAGQVVVAEQLYVRGGAVIINHGLGLFSGMYHLDEVLVQTGQSVEKGQLVGKVGSTGLSTGNHLHWDLLVGGIWIDPISWLDSDLACWVLEGLGNPCMAAQDN